jgi:hypothetical protein
VVLLGEDHDRLAERGATSAALNTALLSIGLVALLCLIAGLTAFALITRPLRRLTETVSQFDIDGVPVTPPTAAPWRKPPAMTKSPCSTPRSGRCRHASVSNGAP